MNKKRILIFLFLVIIIAGGVSAQEKWGGAKNFISGDVGLLHLGARYERFITSSFSLGATAYWNSLFLFFNEVELGAFARYYFVRGFYGELGLGYHTHTGFETYKNDGFSHTEFIMRRGLGISPGLGYKFDPGKPGGFFVEPGISVPITIGKNDWSNYSWYKGHIYTGVSVGFVLYVGLGFAW